MLTNVSDGHPAEPGFSEERIPLLYGGSLFRSQAGEIRLCFEAGEYRADERLPLEISHSSPHRPHSARQFAAQCLLLRYGSNAAHWPEIARRFTNIF